MSDDSSDYEDYWHSADHGTSFDGDRLDQGDYLLPLEVKKSDKKILSCLEFLKQGNLRQARHRIVRQLPRNEKLRPAATADLWVTLLEA